MENIGEIILMSIGTFAMTIIAIGAISFVLYQSHNIQAKKLLDLLHEKQMYSALVQTQENEKLHLAQNLHDELKPMLIAIENKLHTYQSQHTVNRENFDFTNAIDLVNQTKEIVEKISYDLVPSFLVRGGLFSTLEFYITQINNSSFKIDFHNLLSHESENYFSFNQRLQIYRVVLELLHNIIKHDSPKTITVSIKKENDTVLFLFTHNGTGIDDVKINELKKSSQGLGLQSIHGRIELLSGTINYFKEPDVSGIKLAVPI